MSKLPCRYWSTDSFFRAFFQNKKETGTSFQLMTIVLFGFYTLSYTVLQEILMSTHVPLYLKFVVKGYFRN